jgi:acyl-CoA reductase-like NAD-dependent aldehyde dehydrogenase
MKEFKLLIGGQLVSGASSMDVINPATGEVLVVCPRADEAQLNAAVAAAKAAFPAWAKVSIEQRREKLNAIANDMEARMDEFARLLTSEQGKPVPEAMMEMGGAVAMLRILSSFDLPVTVLQDDANEKVVQHRTPLGVVAAITPWNFPMSILVVKITSALLAGNTVVAKPAPTTPLTSLLLAEICHAHLPAGVFNMITDQNDLGGLLTLHPDVAKVSFTGSTATGKKVMGSAGGALKRVTLELGGNDAAIVLEDADVSVVAPKVFAGAMINAGQVCLAIKRVYVPEGMYDDMCTALAGLADAAVVEDGAKQGSQIGPLQNKAQYEKVKTLIETSRKDGKIIAGGVLPEGPGYFIRPTIVRDIADDALLVREEQFGPVLPVLKYSTLDEVLKRANDTTYGLGGTVWAGDPERGLDVAMKIDSGVVWVNSHMNIHPDLPVGGAKHSGVGSELGIEGIYEFTQNHIVYMAK